MGFGTAHLVNITATTNNKTLTILAKLDIATFFMQSDFTI
jgi:hypothetical protein